MKKGLCFIAVLIILLTVAGCGKNADSGNISNQETPMSSNESISEEVITFGKVEKDVFEIETKYCTLKYPNKWKDEVTVDVKDDIVSFSHSKSKTKIFDVIFGDGEGYTLGILNREDESIDVKIHSYEFKKTSKYFEIYCAMENDINVIINRLNSEYAFTLSE